MNDLPVIARKPALCDEVVVVEGLSRSGKKLTCKVLANLQRIEFFSYMSVIENLVHLYYMGHIGKTAAARLIHVQADEQIYERMIGRNLNMRRDDVSCILNAPDPHRYLERADDEDIDGLMQSYRAQGRIPLLHLHFSLNCADVLFEALPGLKIVHIARHPVDIAENWFERGWGRPWDRNPLIFGLTADAGDGVVPWYACDWPDEYFRLNTSERCSQTVMCLQERNSNWLAAADAGIRDRVHAFAFEHLITDPGPTVDGICDFLGTSPGDALAQLLEEEGCPKPLPVERRRENFERLGETASPEIMARLAEASRAYEQAWDLPSFM